MVEPVETMRPQSMLQAAVQSVRWTYSIFWQLCPQQGILVWGDGYYNGAIKTRKTIRPVEVTTEEATQHRSRQIRELYDSLSGEASHPAQRPAAALSPEDLTETEWFYLLCVSFSFPPGAGLPGKTYEKRQFIWLTRANDADNKIFSRSILAKSARMQTVVCIPLLDGVVELGTTERVHEDIGLIQRVKTYFDYDGQSPNHNNPPRPALSEQSTSKNQPTYSIGSLAQASTYPPLDDFGYEDEEDKIGTNRQNILHDHDHVHDHGPMQLDGDTRFESPDGGSNNLNSDFDLLSVGRSPEHQGPDGNATNLQQGFPTYNGMEQEDTHYTQTVSTVLRSRSARWSNPVSSSVVASAFSKWRSSGHGLPNTTHSQRALKYILLTVPLLQGQKLNEQFAALRSLVPSVAKMDEASILGEAIEYMKQLRKRVQELEEGRMTRASVELSIINSDALVEIECVVEKDGLLQELMQVLRRIGVEVTTVQSSICNGVFVAELRAKVLKQNGNSRKTNIMEVKRSINQIIPHFNLG